MACHTLRIETLGK